LNEHQMFGLFIFIFWLFINFVQVFIIQMTEFDHELIIYPRIYREEGSQEQDPFSYAHP
jgi:hypothetical protein